MSLGTVQLGLDYGIANSEGKPDRAKSFSILSAAIDGGVTALDTARAYGDSESVIGAFLKTRPELIEKLFITTKLSSGLPAGSSAADAEKALEQSLETSLSNLGLRKINCLLLHNAADMANPGAVSALRRFVKAGLADMAGVSVYHPDEADLMLTDDIYSAIQLPCNIFDLRFLKTGVLKRLQEHRIKIFIRSVFFQGLLFLDPEQINDPDLLKYAAPGLKTLRLLCEKAGVSIGQFALDFLRSLPGVTSLVLGADNPEQVKENTAYFKSPSFQSPAPGIPALETPFAGEKIYTEAEAAFAEVDYAGIMSVLSRPKKKHGTLRQLQKL